MLTTTVWVAASNPGSSLSRNLSALEKGVCDKDKDLKIC